MDFSLEEFTASSGNIKLLRDIIRNQGGVVCREKIDPMYISNSVLDFTYGYIYMTPVAQIGRRSLRRSEDRFRLLGFIVVRIEPNKKAIITIVCARPNTANIGTLLMQTAEEKARSLNIPIVFLDSLPEEHSPVDHVTTRFSQNSPERAKRAERT